MEWGTLRKINMNDPKKRIEEIEKEMSSPHFWEDKVRSASITRELNELKKRLHTKGDSYPAIITIIAGAGGTDAEDFARMLGEMYVAYLTKKLIPFEVVEEKKNEHGGIRRIVIEIQKKDSYTLLKGESGVHRLVRVSPFNARKQRHTSCSLVEVVPLLPPMKEVDILPDDIEIYYARSSGPGGQNVNKRESSVRIKHKETGIMVHVEAERTQEQNREKAIELLRGKLYCHNLSAYTKKKQEFNSTKEVSVEWGNQIRSYVLHPYKLVKDTRSGYEERDPDVVFDGEIDGFLNEGRKIYDEIHKNPV